MAKDYTDWMRIAEHHNNLLQEAINENSEKNILYFRGKYIYDLKQAHKINPNGTVPSNVNGSNQDIALQTELDKQLKSHQQFIDKAVKKAKKDVKITTPAFSKELGLKICRLSTRVDQANFATGGVERKDLVKDSLSVAGSVVKAPIMITAKVVSKVGPLAITILGLPFTVFAAMLSFVFDPSNDYNNTPVHQLSKELKKAVKNVSATIYETTGKI